MHRSDVRSAGGFTLLEVIIALAITGFVLGGLFSLVGGSKQLTWRSQESLTGHPDPGRDQFALLQNEFAEVEEILDRMPTGPPRRGAGSARA